MHWWSAGQADMAPGFCAPTPPPAPRAPPISGEAWIGAVKARLKRCFSLSKKVFTGRNLLLPFMLQQEVSFFHWPFFGGSSISGGT